MSADPAIRRASAALVLAQTDPLVGSAVTRMFHLLASPAEALTDPDVTERIDAFLGTEPDLERPVDSPTRAEFEALAASN